LAAVRPHSKLAGGCCGSKKPQVQKGDLSYRVMAETLGEG
jgi:hypothetical protein